MPLPYRVLLLLLLALPRPESRAEPLTPLLGPAALTRLQAQLRQSRPDTHRVRLLLTLGTDVLNRSEELNTAVAPAWDLYRQAYGLSQGSPPGPAHGFIHLVDGAPAATTRTGVPGSEATLRYRTRLTRSKM